MQNLFLKLVAPCYQTTPAVQPAQPHKQPLPRCLSPSLPDSKLDKISNASTAIHTKTSSEFGSTKGSVFITDKPPHINHKNSLKKFAGQAVRRAKLDDPSESQLFQAIENFDDQNNNFSLHTFVEEESAYFKLATPNPSSKTLQILDTLHECYSGLECETEQEQSEQRCRGTHKNYLKKQHLGGKSIKDVLSASNWT